MHCKWILNWGIQLTRPAEIALFPRLEAAALGTECRGSKCLMPQNINRVPPISTLVSTFYRVYQSSCHLQQIVPGISFVHIWTFLDHWSYFGPLRVIRTILGYFGPYRPFWTFWPQIIDNCSKKGPRWCNKDMCCKCKKFCFLWVLYSFEQYTVFCSIEEQSNDKFRVACNVII